MRFLPLLTLLVACTNTPDTPTATIESATDSDDYSSWFEGISQADIDDFERQDDADQLSYPTSIDEPDHDPAPGVRSAGSGSAGVDAGVEVDAQVTLDSGVVIDAHVDASIDASADASFDAGFDAGVDGGIACPMGSASAMATIDVSFDVGVRDQFLGSFGPIREHNIWARGSARGAGRLTLSGSISSTATGWTATISANGSAAATAFVHADQQLVSRRRSGWFALGDATLSGSVGFRDSVTFTQTCDPPGVVATSPGTQAISVNVTIDDARFYGYFFPRIQGPVATRIRGAVAQFARNLFNRQLAALIQPRVFSANQAYATKKQELLATLVSKLPAGCGCPVKN